MDENTNKERWSESFLLKTLIALFTLCTALLNFVVASMKLMEGQSEKGMIWTGTGIAFVLISITAFSLRSVQRNYWIRSQKSYEKKLDNIFFVTHNLLHRIRNSINYIESVFFEEKYNNADDFEYKIVCEMLHTIEFISQTFSKITNTEVRACIKCLKYTETPEDLKKIMTFVRSGLPDVEDVILEHEKDIFINENTDFEEIIQSQKNQRQRQFFYEKDLKKYEAELKKKGERYKNSNEYWDKDYITTIVCPIRVKNMSVQNCYNLMGFICIDSKDVKAFDNEYSDFCLDLVKGLADILYVYLERFISYYYYVKEELG